jgi:hypothetical protein
MFSPSSPVTGGAQTGLTSPTYTLTADTAPAPNAKQWAVTALGGTQTGVDVHAVSKPFTLTVFKPAQLRQLGVPNPVTGIIPNIPRNTYSVIVRKGAAPVTGYAPQVAILKAAFEVPAGTDFTEPEEIRAGLSLLIGALSAQSAGLGDTLVTGVL